MMKKVFTIVAFAGLMACSNEPEIYIMGTQQDFTQDQTCMDSLTTVTELLDCLNTLPSNEEVSN